MNFDVTLGYEAHFRRADRPRSYCAYIRETLEIAIPDPSTEDAPVVADFSIPWLSRATMSVRGWDGRFWLSGFCWRKEKCGDDRFFLDDPVGHLFQNKHGLTADRMRDILSKARLGRPHAFSKRQIDLTELLASGGSLVDVDERERERGLAVARALERSRLIVGGDVHVACSAPLVKSYPSGPSEIVLSVGGDRTDLVGLSEAPADLVKACRIRVLRPDLLSRI